jgi:FkbM family methyltransferase
MVRRLMRRAGLELRLFDPLRDDPALRVATLCRNAEVDLLIDLGANDGAWATAVRQAGYGGRILSFEPHPGAFTTLSRRASRDGFWDARQLAIGSQPATMTLYMPGGSVWSSLLRSSSANFEPTQPAASTDVPVKRLDDEVAGGNRLFLKIDVQGYELEALRGAEGRMTSVVAGKAEVLIRQVYDGQPTLLEFVQALASYDLHVVGFEHGHIEENGVERFLDLIFMRY